jgi:hypothetical protein
MGARCVEAKGPQYENNFFAFFVVTTVICHDLNQRFVNEHFPVDGFTLSFLSFVFLNKVSHNSKKDRPKTISTQITSFFFFWRIGRAFKY